MRANIVHADLNPCGGSERLSLVIMRALSEMGIEFDFTTLEQPNVAKLENAFGKSIASVIKNIRRINILKLLEEQSINVINSVGKYTITINTHGDTIPYYHQSFSRNNAITYCHFPTAKDLIKSENLAYLEKDLKITRASSSSSSSSSYRRRLTIDGKHNPRKENAIKFDKKGYLTWLKYAYENLMRNSTVLTNSEFSRKAIFDAFGIDDVVVLSPPVDVNSFRNIALSSGKRDDIILVVSRIDSYKQIENAIKLAKLLKKNNIGKGMKIVGNLDSYNFNYYTYLKKIVMDLELVDYVTFEINISLNKLLLIMQESKVYLHPKPGEHFGISTVEAMSAGLIPVVPDVGGNTEFVPSKYQFHTFGEAVKAISSALDASNSERTLISDSVKKYSIDNFIHHFQQILRNLRTGNMKKIRN